MSVMVLPWVRHRKELEAAREQVEVATQAAQQSQQYRATAHVIAAQSLTSSNLLKRQIDRNGWTEMLLAAWRGRA